MKKMQSCPPSEQQFLLVPDLEGPFASLGRWTSDR